MLTLSALFLVLLWVGFRAYQAQAAYQEASNDVDALQLLAEEDLTSLSASEVATIEQRLDELRLELRELERSTSLPFGSEAVVQEIPWVGPRYEAARDVLEMGLILSDMGASSAQIGREVLVALDETGISADDQAAGPTWLDVMSNHETEIQQLRQQLQRAEDLRAGIDPSLLPGKVQSQLRAYDRAMDRVDVGVLTDVDLDVLLAGLGGEQPARYLLLFQNPAELRPSGGFPGTIALVTVERGQLTSYEFMDVRDLSYDYIDQRETSREQPWPIQEYFPQNGFMIHDATWFAHFPTSGAEVMSMYAETDWPPIDGVVAIEPAAISKILEVIGPVTVTIDDEERQITAENFYDEIEGQRRRRRAGQDVETTHKEAVGVIGEAILAQLKSTDREALAHIVKAVIDSADRRDLQLYAANDEVQSALDRRGWAGALQPEPGVPTLAVTLANVAVNKTSLDVEPSMHLAIEESNDNQRTATLTIDLLNTGGHDPLYDDFQSWWIEVNLPEGSERLSSNPEIVPYPQTPNGGSYLINLFPDQTGRVEITFTMPTAGELLIRRQPGLPTVEFSASQAQCNTPAHAALQRDYVLRFADLCQ